MKTIFAFPFCYHDHNYFDGNIHIQEERYSKIKHNVKEDPVKPFCIKFSKKYLKLGNNYDIIATQASSQFYNNFEDTNMNKDMRKFMEWTPKYLWDFKFNGKLYYIDHHQSHAAYAFLTSKYEESDILAIDGSGRKFKTIFIQKNGLIIDLSKELKIGKLWELISRTSNFGRFSEGKLMGYSAFGSFNKIYYNRFEKIVKDKDIQKFDILSKKYLNGFLTNKETLDYAYTLQQYTIDKVLKYILPLKTSKNLCITGGVAYNGYLNEELLKFWENVHIPPAAGDEGQSLGCYMHCDYIMNKRIKNITPYNGLEYDLSNLNKYETNKLTIKKSDNLYQEIAQEIANGKVIGWFQGRSESGNRALGNRSILADPRNPNIKDYINKKIKMREDFRPFAPAVLEENFKEYFNTTIPSPYMSRIVKTTNKAKKEIPGVIHIDGTARFQSVTKKFNLKFYNLIKEFYILTGVPVLLNTSFNSQEPIVESPQDAINTFRKTKLDILVIDNYIITKVNNG